MFFLFTSTFSMIFIRTFSIIFISTFLKWFFFYKHFFKCSSFYKLYWHIACRFQNFNDYAMFLCKCLGIFKHTKNVVVANIAKSKLNVTQYPLTRFYVVFYTTKVQTEIEMGRNFVNIWKSAHEKEEHCSKNSKNAYKKKNIWKHFYKNYG